MAARKKKTSGFGLDRDGKKMLRRGLVSSNRLRNEWYDDDIDVDIELDLYVCIRIHKYVIVRVVDCYFCCFCGGGGDVLVDFNAR